MEKMKNKKLDRSVNHIRSISNNSKVPKKHNYDFEPPQVLSNYQEIIPTGEESEEKLVLGDISVSQIIAQITEKNIATVDQSSLIRYRFNPQKKTLEVSDDTEYYLIKNFMEEGRMKIDIINEEMNTSHLGRLMLQGYLYFLKPHHYYNYTLEHILKHIKKKPDTWFSLHNLKICWKKLPDQYHQEIETRYKYDGTLCIYHPQLKKNNRIVFYQDKNGDLNIPSMRKMKNFYFTFHFVNPEKTFLHLKVGDPNLNLLFHVGDDILQYQLHEKGIMFYEEFPDYLNSDFQEEIQQLEKTELSENL